MPYCVQKELNHISCSECLIYPVCPDDLYTNGPSRPQKERSKAHLIGNRFRVGVDGE